MRGNITKNLLNVRDASEARILKLALSERDLEIKTWV